MSAGMQVAVIGATGSLGREILTVLSERMENGTFPIETVRAVASSASLGQEISFGEDEVLKVEALETFDFKGIDLALFAVSEEVAKTHVPRATKAGCVVVDTSEAFRLQAGVPLAVAEVSREDLAGYEKSLTVATPSPISTFIALCLAPLHRAFQVRRAVISTYESTSAEGKAAMDELFRQTRGIYVNEPPLDSKEVFPKQIAFNVIPQVGNFTDSGATRQEMLIAAELRKVISPEMAIHANCCRVPVFLGHAAFVTVELEEAISDKAVRELLKEAPGVSVIDHRVEEGYVTPVESVGEDVVYVSRIREDRSVDSGISFWCVGDNLRKGAALNAVDVAQQLYEDFF